MKTTALFATMSLLTLVGCTEPDRTGETTTPPPAETVRPGETAPTPPPSSPQTQPGAPTTEGPSAAATDEALEQRVRQALSGDTSLSASAQSVQVEASGGEVTLRGSVANEQEKQNIAAKVQQTEGVTEVDNQLQIASR